MKLSTASTALAEGGEGGCDTEALTSGDLENIHLLKAG